jgi:cytochrome P450
VSTKPELVERFRTFNHYTTTPEDIRALYAEAHEHCPVIHSEQFGGFYFLTKYEDVKQAAKDWRTFSSAKGVFHPPMDMRIAAIEFDPPEHTWWRNLIMEVTNLATYRSYQDSIARHTDELIDTFAARGHADLVEEYASVLPVLAICEIIGLQDRARMQEARDIGLDLFDALSASPEEFVAQMGRFAGFCLEEVNARRARPRDDFLTRIGTQEADGRMMTDDEIANLLIAFLVAGHHNTSSAFAALLLRVTADPQVRDRIIADPSLAPKVVEEAVRIDMPQGHFFRTTTAEVELSGTTIPAGCPVALSYAAANRDDEAFPDAETFDIDRPRNAHLGFGHGVHTCPGAQLARLELRGGVTRLLERLPDIEYTGEPTGSTWSAASLQMIERLPVTFTPETAFP